MEDKPAATPLRFSVRPPQVAAALALALVAGGSTVFAFEHRSAEEAAGDMESSASSAPIEQVVPEAPSSSAVAELPPVTDRSIIDAVGAPEGSTVLDENVKLWYIDLNGHVREFDNATTGLRSPAPILKKGGAVLFESTAHTASEEGETIEYLALDDRYLEAFLSDVKAYESGSTEFSSVLSAVTNPGAYLQTVKGVSAFFDYAGYSIEEEITQLVIPVSGISSTVDEITSGHMPEISEERAAAENARANGEDATSDYDSDGGTDSEGSDSEGSDTTGGDSDSTDSDYYASTDDSDSDSYDSDSGYSDYSNDDDSGNSSYDESSENY